MIYTHVLARPDVRVVSPLDRLERNEPGGNASERNASERNASVRNKIEGDAMQGNALGISALGISALERPDCRVEDVGSHGTECRATLVQIAELPVPVESASGGDSVIRLKWGPRTWNSFLDWIARSRFQA